MARQAEKATTGGKPTIVSPHKIGGAVGTTGEGAGRGGSRHGAPHWSAEAGDHAPRGKAGQHDGWEINGKISGPVDKGLREHEHSGHEHTSRHR